MKVLTILSMVSMAVILCEGQNIQWFGHKWLDENYLFKWRTDNINKEVTISIEVMTKGWVSFGFSRHGKTTETDMVIGWVDHLGKVTFNDFWINQLGNRSLDMSQDWTLLSGEENATHTVLEFRRHYVTCDESNDIEIFENDFEESNIVFGYSFIDPNCVETIGEPTVEEVFHLNIFEKTENLEPKETDIEIIDNWFNMTLAPTSDKILVICELTKIKLKEKRQIVKYQTTTTGTHIKVNHHFGFIKCPNEPELEKYLGVKFHCYESNDTLVFLRQKCNKISIVSPILSENQVDLVENAGITLDPAHSLYYLYEVHLKNPSEHDLNIGLNTRFWLTRQFRKYEVSMQHIVGTSGFLVSNWGFIVPPKQPRFSVAVAVSTYCFENDKFDENGVIIFSFYFHSHHGTGKQLRHYRNDQVIRYFYHNHYDPDNQPYRFLKNPIHLKRGDKIILICDYNSMGETKSFMPPSDHCAILALYYPSIPMFDERFYCSRLSYETMLKITGLQRIEGYGIEIQDKTIIREPLQYNNTKLSDFIAGNKYRINDPKQLEELEISADLIECCYHANISYAKSKSCKPIKIAPGLYQSIQSRGEQNSCPPGKYRSKNDLAPILDLKSGLSMEMSKLKLSFTALFN